MTPLLQELEVAYPAAEIDIITQSKVAWSIFSRYPRVRDIHLLPTRPLQHPIHTVLLLRHLRNTNYDLAIDPDAQSQTGRLLLMQARALHKISFVTLQKSGHLTHCIPVPSRPSRKGLRPVFLLRSAIHGPHLDPEGERYPSLDIRLSAAERQQGQKSLVRLLASHPVYSFQKNKIIGIFADATGGKKLDPDWWRRFLVALEAGYPDFSFVEIVPEYGRSLLDARYPTYYSSHVRKLAATLSGLSLYISADCGVMHLASAVQIPVAAIFNVTNAAEWAPYGHRASVIDASNADPETVAKRIIELRPYILNMAGDRVIAGRELPHDQKDDAHLGKSDKIHACT